MQHGPLLELGTGGSQYLHAPELMLVDANLDCCYPSRPQWVGPLQDIFSSDSRFYEGGEIVYSTKKKKRQEFIGGDERHLRNGLCAADL